MNKIEKEVKKFLKERNWDKLRPSDIAKSISIESAELLELFQWNSMTIDEVKKDKEKFDSVKKELADVFLYSFDMAVLLGLDAEKIILEKLKRAREKYPPHLIKKSQGAEPGTDKYYLKIKSAYRRKGKS